MSADDRQRREPAASPAELAAALARYRPLFGDVVDDWDGFIDALARPLATCIWSHPGRIDGARLAGLLEEQGVPAAPVPWLASTPGTALLLPPAFKPGQHWWYCAGLAHAQEAVSQLPPLLMDLAPGQRVLDLCAAPGGKTAQIALALGNRGTVLANDFAPERIAALQGNLDRLGVVNVSTTWADGGNYPAAAGPFDRILVDAPCSSEGTLRRNLSLVRKIGPERSQRMASRQRALLRKAVQLCRPGGRIVYSTCTFAPEENELVVADILAEQDGRLRLMPAPVSSRLPGLVSGPGVTRWQGRTLPEELAHCLRVWPHANDTGGFFIAVLEKGADARGLPQPEALALRLEPDDAAWCTGVAEHYGLPEPVEAAYRIQRQSRRGLHLAAADHAPPAAPAPQGSGVFFHRTNVRPPKLTTAGAQLLGATATRQVLDLDAPAERDAHLRRETLTPTPAQRAACHPGQVIVRHRGWPLGVAVLHRSGDLESLFPRKWSGCTAGG
ncbi:MAG: RsmB/NOP family class I SAM-dependent RNA methyltransferase [Thiohalocapsa sp.]|jgi:NOL1/NOP2/sun family putative RNA methylase|uniref:RsmB/NOP family class I SAM-dependent RNA methyltransferase n=1 Tax=Thiohalocapsa sp. TaxID=2497641 RepID=UPI0025E48EB5|nr:RsmB/NOP family class I SAM-dependent RNA methyltransferase [Thiohalocapsa sp.]MCG6942462.1 RsmB/NOP family class I SAM-dependent RNA methyltransferase [Thiohalocapsa sp.]